jgi:hypothetical protein
VVEPRFGPGLIVWTLLTVPFYARAFIAATVAARVRGIPPSARNDPPLLKPTDFPAPNRARRTLLYSLASTVIALPLALVAEAVTLLTVPSVLWQGAFLAIIGIVVAWTFRRLRSDDALARQIRFDRSKL